MLTPEINDKPIRVNDLPPAPKAGTGRSGPALVVSIGIFALLMYATFGSGFVSPVTKRAAVPCTMQEVRIFRATEKASGVPKALLGCEFGVSRPRYALLADTQWVELDAMEMDFFAKPGDKLTCEVAWQAREAPFAASHTHDLQFVSCKKIAS